MDTRLIPPLLSSSLPSRAWRTSSTATAPTVFFDIRTLRTGFLLSTLQPSFSYRPPAEQKWIAELALHNHQLLPYDEAKVLPCVPGMVDAVRSHPTITPFTTRAVLPLINTSAAEWSLRWGSIKALRLSGPTRSFMWRLSHRRLPLLSQQWLADHYQRPTTCIMCTSGERETFSHLFSDCATASSLWSTLHPLLSLLHMNHLVDQRPARLIGDLSPFSLSWLQTTNWSSVSASPPSTTQLLHLVRGSWTAIRAITLKAIWDAKCDFLHTNTRKGARALPSSRSDPNLPPYIGLPAHPCSGGFTVRLPHFRKKMRPSPGENLLVCCFRHVTSAPLTKLTANTPHLLCPCSTFSFIIILILFLVSA